MWKLLQGVVSHFCRLVDKNGYTNLKQMEAAPKRSPDAGWESIWTFDEQIAIFTGIAVIITQVMKPHSFHAGRSRVGQGQLGPWLPVFDGAATPGWHDKVTSQEASGKRPALVISF